MYKTLSWFGRLTMTYKIMENQPQQNTQQPQQPAQPAPMPAAQPAAQPAQPAPRAQSAPAAQPVPTAKPAQTAAKPATGHAKDQGKKNKNLVIGCVSAFGCSILLFVGVLFAFLAFGSPDNPIFGFLGAPAGEVVNVLITLVNLIFLFLVFLAFIFVVIGVFKITTARKDDKETKRKGAMFTFASFAVMFLLIFTWIFAYFFLASKRTIAPRLAITTEPEKTINLTAPVTIKFNGGKAAINKQQFDILSYTWNFGDKTVLTGNPQTHTFTDIGNFKVKLTIIVKEKATGKEQEISFMRDVTIQNVLATVVIKADKKSGPAPLAINLDGSDSRSPNGEITAYAWDLDEDGQFDDGTNSTAQTMFNKIGVYKVALRVTDSTGAFATGELEVEVTPPDTPVAVITVEGASENKLETGKAYIFSAANSTSPSGAIEKYNWDFGDSGKAQTRTASHAYQTPGEYDVTLTVVDSAKKKGEATQRFTVSAPTAAPLASLQTTPVAKDNIVAGQAPFTVIFDASGSQDLNNDIVEYSWDFDGDSKKDDANAVTSHTYTAAGTYNASLTVTDSTELSAATQVVIKVETPGLKANIKAEPIAGVVPLTVQFDASGSSYPDGSIVAYEWNFGDSAQPRTDAAKVSHQYIAIGTFTAKVTAITSDNKRASAEIPITVRPVSVKACFEASAESGKAPLEIQFDPTCSTGSVVKYRWNFANLSQSAERKPKFTFKDPGEYNVSLQVADSQNVVDAFTKTITVEAQ